MRTKEFVKRLLYCDTCGTAYVTSVPADEEYPSMQECTAARVASNGIRKCTGFLIAPEAGSLFQ